jgi:hypothetical protein
MPPGPRPLARALLVIKAASEASDPARGPEVKPRRYNNSNPPPPLGGARCGPGPAGPAAAARARATLNFKFAGDLKLRPVGLGGLSHSTETVTLNLTRASGSTMPLA